jgi:hypothetical protein
MDHLLNALETGSDIFGALDEIRPLHPKNNTFPGEVFIRLGAAGLDEGAVNRDKPVTEEGLVERYLPECQFRGRENHKIRYAILTVAASHGGVEVDLLEEVAYWRTDDFWSYAALAATAWIRAIADQRALDIADLCRRLRARTGVAIIDS